MPEYMVTKDGNLYDFMRKSDDGKTWHIPMFASKSTELSEVKKSIDEIWGRLNV